MVDNVTSTLKLDFYMLLQGILLMFFSVNIVSFALFVISTNSFSLIRQSSSRPPSPFLILGNIICIVTYMEKIGSYIIDSSLANAKLYIGSFIILFILIVKYSIYE